MKIGHLCDSKTLRSGGLYGPGYDHTRRLRRPTLSDAGRLRLSAQSCSPGRCRPTIPDAGGLRFSPACRRSPRGLWCSVSCKGSPARLLTLTACGPGRPSAGASGLNIEAEGTPGEMAEAAMPSLGLPPASLYERHLCGCRPRPFWSAGPWWSCCGPGRATRGARSRWWRRLVMPRAFRCFGRPERGRRGLPRPVSGRRENAPTAYKVLTRTQMLQAPSCQVIENWPARPSRPEPVSLVHCGQEIGKNADG